VAQTDAVFLQAFEAVRGRHSIDEWLSAAPQRITRQIYEEMRRLDLIRAQEMLRPTARKKRVGSALVTLHSDATSRHGVRQLPSGLRANVA
jgi:hypothetical protein